jgi:hypothetical protein
MRSALLWQESAGLVKRSVANTTWHNIFKYDAAMDLSHVWTKACAPRLNMSA